MTWIIVFAPKHVRKRPRNILWLLVPNVAATALWAPAMALAIRQLGRLDQTLEDGSFLIFVIVVFAVNL